MTYLMAPETLSLLPELYALFVSKLCERHWSLSGIDLHRYYSVVGRGDVWWMWTLSLAGLEWFMVTWLLFVAEMFVAEIETSANNLLNFVDFLSCCLLPFCHVL